jgi:tetratricopeptide (TPR) repeat protein
MKLIVFCIDGLEPSIVLDHQKKFPFFEGLCKTGVYAELLDTEPCGSIGKWLTFLTGASFHHHGVEEGVRHCSFPRLSNIRRFESSFLWNVLNHHGYSVGLANFYGTYPAPALQGFAWCEPQCLLSGMGTGFVESEMIYPRALTSDFAVMSYPEIHEPRSLQQLGIRQSWEELKNDARPLENMLGGDYYAEFARIIAKRADWTSERLIRYCKKFFPDVLFYYNWDLDKLQHFSWHEEGLNAIFEGYSQIERLIQCLCEHLKPENILVFSDHGHASFKDLLAYDYHEVHPEMARFYEERDRSRDFVTFANGTHVIHGQNQGIVSGTHAMKGMLMASGDEIPGRGRMPLVPFRYMYTGVLRLLHIDAGEFLDWERVDPHKNWFEPDPDTIPAMFNELKALERQNFDKYWNREMQILRRICEADVDGQFHRFTVPCATKIATLYFDNNMFDEAHGWLQYALSLDPEILYSHYSVLNLQRLAYLDQVQGNLQRAMERYLDLARMFAGTEGVRHFDEAQSLRSHIKKLEKLLEERSQWAQSLDKTLTEERAQFARLQSEFEERTEWALALDQELQRLKKDRKQSL